MRKPLVVIAAGLALVACRQEPVADTPPPARVPPARLGSCDAAKVQDLVGKANGDAVAQDAKARSGAKVVRTLTPDMVITMEYSGDRLNLHVGTNGVIGSVRCG